MKLLDLEAAILQAPQGEREPPPASPDDAEAWTRFCLRMLLAAGRTVRSQRLVSWDGSELDMKGDGSPATVVDRQVERDIRGALELFAPEAQLVGEETGGDLPASGMALAVDPIDGTWAFVTSSSTHASSLAVFRDGTPWLGFMGNPATGEIAYTHPDQGARLLQLNVFGEGSEGYSLPLKRGQPGKVLVSLHPNRAAAGVSQKFYEAWNDGDLRMLRAPGGSPVDALMECSKGRYTYVNLWGKAPAEPYDLAAGTLLLRAAGGDVVDLQGQPIQTVGHEGTFVAGMDAAGRDKVLRLMADTLDPSTT